jgi:hypothetical protein
VENDEYVTAAEGARLLGYKSRRALYDPARQRRLKLDVYKLGGSRGIRFKRHQVLAVPKLRQQQ